MTQPMQHSDVVFPKWVTAGLILGWISVMAWITNFVGLTSGLA